ncbi:hypothetical protein CLOM_g13817 [Closterium sp. NIES-68]|nr:hypothetical protein CLOM_g13817 [Closterium sp. NIES-68]
MRGGRAGGGAAGVVGSIRGPTGRHLSAVRTISGKPAAIQGVRVFLHDEYSTSQDALDLMIQSGCGRKDRQEMLDAFAAAVLLRSYFESQGAQAVAVVPKSKQLLRKLCKHQTPTDGPATDVIKREASDASEASEGFAATDVTASAPLGAEQRPLTATPREVAPGKKRHARNSKAPGNDLHTTVGIRAQGKGGRQGKLPLKNRRTVSRSNDDFDDGDDDDDDSLFDGDWEAAFKLK